MSVSTFLLFLVVFVAMFDISKQAFAYLDPGSGSVLLQLLLGGMAGIIVVLKLYWNRLKSLFWRKSRH